MKCKNTIINEMVANTAHVLEAKMEFNELLIGQYGPEAPLVAKLKADNIRIANAVELMREQAGCWA